MENGLSTSLEIVSKLDLAGPGQASNDVVLHHLKSFLDNNVDAVLSDYTTDSVLVTEAATFRSLEEIRGFFTGLNRHFPKQQSAFVLDKMVAVDDVVYIVWHATTPSLEVTLGSDTFIIRNGKIFKQTFVGVLHFLK